MESFKTFDNDMNKGKAETQKNIKNKKLYICIIVLIALVLFFIGFVEVQRYIFFHPWNNVAAYEQLKEIQWLEEVNIDNNWSKLNWWLYHNNQKWKKSPLLIFFQWNAMCSSNTMLSFWKQWILDNYFSWYNVLIVDYPWYGYSEWKVWEKAMYGSADAIYQWAIKQVYVDSDNIVIMGYSIWTWIATYCASNNKVNWLILVAPYDNAINLYNSVLNIFYGPIKLLAKYRFDSLSYAKNVDPEVQIITSYDDEIINYKLSQNLMGGFKKHKDIVILDNWVKHNNYFYQEKVLDTIKEYLLERLK